MKLTCAVFLHHPLLTKANIMLGVKGERFIASGSSFTSRAMKDTFGIERQELDNWQSIQEQWNFNTPLPELDGSLGKKVMLLKGFHTENIKITIKLSCT